MKKLKALIEEAPTLPTNLAFIQSYVAFLLEFIKKLEICSQTVIVKELSILIYKIPGLHGRFLKKKCAQVFGKNVGYTNLRKLNNTLINGLPCPHKVTEGNRDHFYISRKM